jgi:hypothetical protein
LPPSFAPSPQAPTSEDQVAVSQPRELIEDVFMNTAASMILKVVQARCEYDETFQMEYMKLIGSQPNRVFADENQLALRKETHARVNSQDLTRKRFVSRRRQIIALMTRKDATQEEQHAAWSRHFRETITQDHRALPKVCVQCDAKSMVRAEQVCTRRQRKCTT